MTRWSSSAPRLPAEGWSPVHRVAAREAARTGIERLFGFLSYGSAHMPLPVIQSLPRDLGLIQYLIRNAFLRCCLQWLRLPFLMARGYPSSRNRPRATGESGFSDVEGLVARPSRTPARPASPLPCSSGGLRASNLPAAKPDGATRSIVSPWAQRSLSCGDDAMEERATRGGP